MIFDNIRRKAFRILLFALLVLLLLYVKDLLDGVPDKVKWTNSIFAGLPDIFSGQVSTAISIILTLISGMLIYKIGMDHISVAGREHLLVWLWVLQAGGLPFLHPLSEAHFATVFILLSYGTLFNIYRKAADYREIFMSSMYLGIAALFYSFAIYLYIPYIIALYRFKIAELKDWTVSIAGLLDPFYFAIFASWFLMGNWMYPIETTVNNIIPDSLSMKTVEMNMPQYIFCTFISVLVLIEILTPSRLTRQRMNQKTISCLRSVFILMFFSILILLFFPSGGKLMLQIIFIPTTIYLRTLFVKINKSIIANTLFILLITISMIVSYIG
ncbi:MAG: hypothetical protein LBH60_06175 [Prevotellaceae bacterium]|jgi:hypothetical protein|nr:hypothetical protein [Prevotellaceae bacterium]